MTPTLEQALDVAVRAARAGGAELMQRFGSPLTHTAKGHLDFATEADVASERAILAVLQAGSPWPVTGEETGSSGSDASDGYRWYVDPLCGTVNFANGIRLFCVNVALCRHGVPELGVSLDPTSGETFVGAAGSKAWVEGVGSDRTALQPSTHSGLVDVDFRHAEPGRPSYQTYRIPLLTTFSDRFAPVRLNTSLSLAYVAAGRFAGYVHDGTQMQVHFAAGVAIARAAGAVVTDRSGYAWRVGASGLIAAASEGTASELLSMWQTVHDSI